MSDYQHVPAPGSRMDGAAAAAAAAGDGQVPAEAIGEVSGDVRYVVPVAVDLPALGRGYVVVLGPNNPVLPLLPQDPARRSAIVLAVDTDVYVGPTREGAAAAAGTTTGTGAGYLPAGIAIPLDNKAAWYVAATNLAVSARVSVWISLDSE